MDGLNNKKMIENVNIKLIIPHPNNPRLIKDDKFKKLVKSIQDFPEMLALRPIIVDDNYIVLGGNMRLRACIEAGLKKIPIIKAGNLTPEQQKEFIIKDNVGFGEWDWDILANAWDSELLAEWGLDVWQNNDEPDYSILDSEDLTDQLGDMAGGVRKAIQIEFEPEHYEEAQELVKFWRGRELYIGGLLIEKLKEEKLK
jgi:hypothetical protein